MRWQVLPYLLLLFCMGEVTYGQNAVSFSSKVQSKSIGTYAEFAFIWGDGNLLSVGGQPIPLSFDSKMYESREGMNYLQSKTFTLDKSTQSVNFGLGYKFFVEALKKSQALVGQGLMVLDFELYDVKSGEVHPRQSSLLEECSVEVASGEDYEKSVLKEVSIEIDPNWISSKSREVVVRVVFNVVPSELVRTASPVVVESLPPSLSNYSFQ